MAQAPPLTLIFHGKTRHLSGGRGGAGALPDVSLMSQHSRRYGDRMFEAAAERWKEYLSRVSGSWPQDDVRHNLGGEVRDRLRQLDRILRHLHAAIRAVSPDPVEAQQKMEWALANQHRVASGEITEEEFIQGSHIATRDPATLVDSWDDVSIFTEEFYFCAWAHDRNT
jgi:hypothetical protein